MRIPLSTLIWSTPALWQEANRCLAITIRKNRSTLDQPRRQAMQIADLLDGIFPRMEDLCRQTCPDCQDNCCQRAWVWADFKDLLFFHLAGIAPPDRQLLNRRGGHCRHGGPGGCRLDRIRRPFVCTWYLCPAQTRHLTHLTAEKTAIVESLHRIKILRGKMETAFIRVVA